MALDLGAAHTKLWLKMAFSGPKMPKIAEASPNHGGRRLGPRKRGCSRAHAHSLAAGSDCKN
eukprot:4730034-Prymnesium_polylepis.1